MSAFKVVRSTQTALLVCAGQKASAESASGDQCRQEHVCSGAGCASSAGQGLPGNSSHAQVMTDVNALQGLAADTTRAIICDAGMLCSAYCHVCVEELGSIQMGF